MPLRPDRFFARALACAGALLLAGSALAATPSSAKPAAKPPAKSVAKPTTKAAARPAPRPAAQPAQATTRQQANNTAKGLALATATVETISAGQLDVAARVLTGVADCEFNQRITVQALAGQPGYFTVSHQGRHYRMLPRETATGAVRLEDPVNGIVWLQIPAKSMLMNAWRGQRLVDSCMHAEQHAAVAASTQAGQGIGIVAPVVAAAMPATGASAPAASSAAPADPAAQAGSMPTATAPAQPAAATAAPLAPTPAASAP